MRVMKRAREGNTQSRAWLKDAKVCSTREKI